MFPFPPLEDGDEPPIPPPASEEPPFPPAEKSGPINPREFAEPERLPPIDERDIALHAAEAIEFRVPKEWRTGEVPFGREIRMVILPPGAPLEARMPSDGVWISYHVRPFRREPQQQEINNMLADRLTIAAPGAAVDANLVEEPVSKLPSASQAFIRRRPNEDESTIGFHMLIGSEDGVIELHAESPVADSAAREKAWQEPVEALVITAPQIPEREPKPEVSDAKRILGSWKSMRSTLTLTADGEITVVADPKPGVLLDGAEAPKPEVVTGKFQAKDDLIMVMWKDGSRLNYRWKKEGIRLLMTDSEGRISQMRRFYAN